MTELATVAHEYLNRFKAHYGATISDDQWSALNAILGCRSGQYGEVQVACHACTQQNTYPQSCGHRACNQCQHHCTTQWLERQEKKLLPVDYFMVTFTLPYELRSIAKANPKTLYALLFQCAVSTLKDFGMNEVKFAAELAMTAVLHTHTRRLDYHPHLHVIVPGGGINKQRNEWRKVKGHYLFNGYALAKVFRGRMLSAMMKAGLTVPVSPKKWVVQCQSVGRGLPALKYLSRYLYRGVVSNQQILNDDGRFVTFQYQDAKSKRMKTRKLSGEAFIALVLQHVLPKGFRRSRDYGFLHGNAKKWLQRVQWLLQVVIPKCKKRERPQFMCPQCHEPMSVIGFHRPQLAPG